MSWSVTITTTFNILIHASINWNISEEINAHAQVQWRMQANITVLLNCKPCLRVQAIYVIENTESENRARSYFRRTREDAPPGAFAPRLYHRLTGNLLPS